MRGLGHFTSRRVHGKTGFFSFPRMTRLILVIIAVRREGRRRYCRR